jgi:hypothetical protein
MGGGMYEGQAGGVALLRKGDAKVETANYGGFHRRAKREGNR